MRDTTDRWERDKADMARAQGECFRLRRQIDELSEQLRAVQAERDALLTQDRQAA